MSSDDVLVQYIVVRKDLTETCGFDMQRIIAMCCHAW